MGLDHGGTDVLTAAVQRGRPRLEPPGPRDRAVAQVLSRARRERRISVRVLLQRMRQPISAPTYARCESGQRMMTHAVLVDICQAMGLDAEELLGQADVISERSPAAEISFLLDPRGPQVPAIRVRVFRLMDPDQVWLEPVRGMLRLQAANNTDAQGDLLLDEPLVRVVAQILAVPVFDCWTRLSKFIEHD